MAVVARDNKGVKQRGEAEEGCRGGEAEEGCRGGCRGVMQRKVAEGWRGGVQRRRGGGEGKEKEDRE